MTRRTMPLTAADTMATAMTEDELLFNVMDTLAKFRWLAYHTHDSRRSTAGFPDICAVRGGTVIFAELKVEDSKRGMITIAQQRWKAALEDCADDNEACGVEYYLWRPSQWISGEIERVLK